MRWKPDGQTRGSGGRFQVIARAPNRAPEDITFLRGAPIKIGEYSTADPFGWAGARLELPQVTGFDEFGAGDLAWLTPHTLFDIRWLPSVPDVSPSTVDAITNQVENAWLPTSYETVWEGHLASPTMRGDDNGDSWGLDLIGALYQTDGYKAKPRFPYRPIPHEKLIAEGFDVTRFPHLKTHPAGLRIDWPAGWTKVFTTQMRANATIYTPDGLKVGEKYTGYSTRQTGSWDNWLTSFVQDLLAVLWVDDESGVIPGNQWTLLCEPGRRPVLKVRDRQRTPDFEFWYGTPGVEISNISMDYSQTSDILYGEGDALDGSSWRNAEVSIDGTRTEYVPLIKDAAVYPMNPEINPQLDITRIIRERMVKFAPGISLEQAQRVSGPMAAQDRDPGMTGTMTLKIDPAGMNRWQIRAGMAVRVKGLAGSGDHGIVFHINETTANPEEGTLTCKIDTKFRDLLAFEEAVARTRDPLIPSRLLQVNRSSITIEDQRAPWDYKAGSGFMPKAATRFFADLPRGETFPWATQAAKYQPGNYPDRYIRVNADSSLRRNRWTIFPILMAEKGAIRLIQMAAFDRFGVQTKVPFHLSLYSVEVTADNMPFDSLGPSPFIPGAFQTVTVTGDPIPPDSFLLPDANMIIGWGDSDQKAGYSPGSESDGDPATGRLVDASTWTFDCTLNPDFDRYAAPGVKAPQSAYTIYGALYAEYTEDLYFIGRMFRQEPGT